MFPAHHVAIIPSYRMAVDSHRLESKHYATAVAPRCLVGTGSGIIVDNLRASVDKWWGLWTKTAIPSLNCVRTVCIV